MLRSCRGLVLAAGLGKRLRPLTNDRPKGALPVADEVITGHNVLKLVEAGIKEIGVVVGHKAEKLKEALGDGSRFEARLYYFLQHEPKGTAHAVLCAKEFCQEGPFVLVFGDNVSDAEIGPLMDLHQQGLSMVTVAVKKVSDPRGCGVVCLHDSWVTEVEEKPQRPKSDMAIAGFFFIEPEFLLELERVPERPDGERYLTDALHKFATEGKVRAWVAQFWRVNVNTQADLLKANEGLLKRKAKAPQVREEFEIVPPCHLSCNAEVGKGAIIGPYTTVCEEVVIGPGAKVERSIILPKAVVGGCSTLVNCVVGEGAKVPPGLSLVGTEREPEVVPHFQPAGGA